MQPLPTERFAILKLLWGNTKLELFRSAKAVNKESYHLTAYFSNMSDRPRREPYVKESSILCSLFSFTDLAHISALLSRSQDPVVM